MGAMEMIGSVTMEIERTDRALTVRPGLTMYLFTQAWA